MPETTESESQSETQAEPGSNVINELCDAVRYMGDVSYAFCPRTWRIIWAT